MSEREQHFKQLFLSEYGRIYKAAYILLGDEDEAKDAVQDVFTKLWDDTTPLRDATAKGFLLTCIRNRCLNIIARKNSELKITNERLCECQPVVGLDDEELIAAVCRYVDEKLSPQTSRVIKMHYREEQSYKEIAGTLGISLSAVNKHIVQGLRKLRIQFKDKTV